MAKDELGLLWFTWRIFDHEDGIYMDDCHVYERGNEIIANSIYEVIKDKLIREEKKLI